MNKDEESYEAVIARLQEIVAKLEEGDLPLDQSLKLFEEGVALARECARKLDEAQGLIEKLIESANGQPQTVPVDPDSL